MSVKVLMLPQLNKVQGKPGGIFRVVEGWHSHAAEFGIEYVDESATSYDLLVSHAGTALSTTGEYPDIHANHGLYWSNDYPLAKTHLKTNAKVIDEIRHAKEVTVPSPWVAQVFQRDMRFSPHVIPHGIDWREWLHEEENEGYVLFNKTRPGDACSPQGVTELAHLHPDQLFLTTFATESAPPNIRVMGTVPHLEMKRVIQRAGVYLSLARETFGVGTLEAMASGVPVLGWDYGGNRDLVQHGVTGYLAQPENYEQLADGLDYCLRHRKTLGQNAREAVKAWTWRTACEKVHRVYRLALVEDERPMLIEPSLYQQDTGVVK